MKCQTNQFNCPVEATLSLIGGKYKPLILWHLIDHPLHYISCFSVRRFSSVLKTSPCTHNNSACHHTCEPYYFHCGKIPVSITEYSPNKKSCKIACWNTKESE